ncbi:MAG TPA: hypothetical protein VIK32_10155 [Candidatus Limnocylindrales bacterium]
MDTQRVGALVPKKGGAAIEPPIRVAAAIIGVGGRPVGAISVCGPHFRVHDHLGQFREQVRATATQIAWELGADTLGAGRPFTNGAHGPRPGAGGNGTVADRRRPGWQRRRGWAR